MSLSFELSDKEEAASELFQEIQIAAHPTHTTASGGRFVYIFTPTGVGNAVTIKDNETGEEKNITDYSCW